MPDTQMSDEWIKKALAKNPCVILSGGNVRTCPVRLSFPYLFTPQKPLDNDPNKKPKYQATLLFPVGADVKPLRAAIENALLEKWPDPAKAGSLHRPFRDQGEKTRFQGYEEGAVFITVTGERKPPVVDTRLAPIVDENAIYPGVWAIVTVRPFVFDQKLKKGASFGLQSVMKIADDVAFGGAQSDPNVDFEGVSIEMPADVAALM